MTEGKAQVVAVCDADAVFRVFTACPHDPKTLIIDVRDKKKWDRGHIAGSYCIRLPASGGTLLDYSKCEYDLKWSTDVWWNKDCIVYGEAGLKRDHPVVAFLANEKRARSIAVFREGLEAFQQRYPFLVTTSVRAGAGRRYPSQLEPLLYLGDWSHAEALERHAELGIRAVVTIHNNPDNLRLPPGRYSHLKIELPDIETADISAHLRAAYDFIEEARAAKRAVLVHCGAGVSRSATLCIAYLMRKHRWSAQRALELTKARRSLVAPNDGFWRTLCALEAQLGIAERWGLAAAAAAAAVVVGSNADAFAGFHGADAPVVAEIVEPKVQVTFIPAGATSAPAGSKAQAPAPPPKAPLPAERGGELERRRERSRSRSRDRRRRSHSRERRRSRSRSRDRQRRRSRSRSRDRRRDGSRERRRRDEEPRGGAAAEPAPAQQQQEEERVDVESTEGAVLEVVREGKSLGHLVVELWRVSQECVFGRMPSCDVQLEHLSISRAHAQLTTDGAGNLFVTDMGSAHGTNVDDAWIKAKVPKQLRVGSVFKFGASVRQYKVAKLPQRTAARR
ncbi:hypothetical protein CHLNCDRAFT_138968 [Chlorella variabilis]|uniref:protein-tyrosine-phosphatase n=1 Tax=Chlorella variabilis TaxID=554065 RepID=E1ZP22_CHLVA|nr:hypothetical protein CHLNCDRAFT_138968 [Chlorella variabilis]EFN52440.1 hypothetical protein CHLNCDRAFT_138968 [Chlorella variabilis]|eukprot:XP_005844542.1 hypothetical protein CHLNCDRAFT_138968 [Chlorella variabilis]